MEYLLFICKLCRVETRRWLFMVGIVAFTYLLFQSLLLPYGDALRSLLPDVEAQERDQNNIPIVHSSAELTMVRNPLTILDLANTSTLDGKMKDTDNDTSVEGFLHDSMLNSKRLYMKKEESLRDGYELSVDGDFDIGSEPENTVEINDILVSHSIKNRVVNNSILHGDGEESFGFTKEQLVKPNGAIVTEANVEEFKDLSSQKPEGADRTFNASPSMLRIPTSLVVPDAGYLMSNITSSVGSVTLLNNQTVLDSGFKNITKRKKMKSEIPPKSITLLEEMNSILVRHRRSSRAMKPRRSSLRDQEIFSAKSQIEQGAAINDPELYAPLFRNVSMFKR